MIWTDYFTLVKVLPGRIITPRFGTLDFSDPSLPLQKLQALFEDDFLYLQIAPLGMETLYPVPPLAKLFSKKDGNTHSSKETRKTKSVVIFFTGLYFAEAPDDKGAFALVKITHNSKRLTF